MPDATPAASALLELKTLRNRLAVSSLLRGHRDLDDMLPVVVDQRNRAVASHDAIQANAGRNVGHRSVAHRDPIQRLAVAVADFARGPVRRQAGREAQSIPCT